MEELRQQHGASETKAGVDSASPENDAWSSPEGHKGMKNGQRRTPLPLLGKVYGGTRSPTIPTVAEGPPFGNGEGTSPDAGRPTAYLTGELEILKEAAKRHGWK